MIDLATLTGACVVALGEKIAGLMGNDDEWIDQVQRAADRVGERVWPLPLPTDYRKGIESPIADIKNVGAARRAARSPRGCSCRSSSPTTSLGPPRHRRARLPRQ